MANIKKLGLYLGMASSLATIAALVIPNQAASRNESHVNSPTITGNGNNVSYQQGFPDLETIRAQRPNISDAQYAAIKPGMTYQQVLDIVKIPGKESASNGPVQIYTWGTEIYVYMTVTLINGRVQSKSN